MPIRLLKCLLYVAFCVWVFVTWGLSEIGLTFLIVIGLRVCGEPEPNYTLAP